MDVGTNKTRKDTRAVVELVARYRSPSTFEYVEEACCDVSLGGMFIRSKDPAAAGTLLKLECESGDGEHIRGVARVVWLRAQTNEYGPSGMGVKFVKLDPESRDLITRLVQELAEAGIETPSMSSAPELRGKPPSKRPGSASSTPAAAEPPPPPPSKAAELSSTRPLSGSPPRNDVAVLHRASDRAAGTPPPPPPISSKPPGVSSRPAPSNALLAHAKVEPLEIEAAPSGSGLAPLQELGRDLAPPQEIGRDLAPLQAMVRSSRVSSVPPPEERSGRAFWLVAGAVVALGAIVTLLSLRAAREPGPGESQAAGGATPSIEAPSPTSMNRADPTPAEATGATTGAEGASAQPNDPQEGAEPAAQQGAQAEAPAEQFADPELVAAADPAAAPSEPAQVPVAAPAAAESIAQQAQPAAASEGTAAPPTAAAAPPARAAAPTQATPQPSAAAPTPAARPSMADVPPVVRIVPNDQPPAAAQPSASAASTPPSAANANPAPAPAAPAPAAAAASSSPAAATTPNKVEPPPLPPGEIARVITFTSRPPGASIFVGEQTVTTPGELNLGAMPARIRVTAQKEGFESSTVWINNTAEFVKVGGVMKREVHFVLRALPAVAPGAPAQPSAAVQPPPAAPPVPGQP